MNRNKIGTPQGWCYLTIPVERKYYRTSFKDVRLPNDSTWKNKHWKSIKQNYTKAPFFESYYDSFKKALMQDYGTLLELNFSLIKYLFQHFGIKIDTIKSSDLGNNSSFKGTDMIMDLLTKVNATSYLSGIGGKNYLDIKKFNKIKLYFQEFNHPIYSQVYPDFIPNLSAIDFLFNTGGKGFNGV